MTSATPVCIELITLIVTAIIGVITIFAIWYAPRGALKAQKKIEAFNEKNGRKLDIFKTLLATRGYPLSFEHVRALNLIDIEFYGCTPIRESWNLYRDHLNSQYPSNDRKEAQAIWDDRQKEYLTDLLYVMSKLLGYDDFDKVILKKGSYNPIAHGILDLEQRAIRIGFISLLSGNTPLKVVLAEQQQPTQTDYNNYLNNIPMPK